ncbi:MAG TPA: aminotransferase class V-fold PLP-dependent enzyme [Solirubrobacteraceae bacterium]|nr:aminotransferase class V-fold PLP-dependent enzyme [Solirubrobacteraceae bacterium]
MPATLAIAVNDLRRGVLADEELAEAVSRVTLSGRYLLGEETCAFERELADYLGVGHVVGVASGTAALQLAFRALGGGPGQEVVSAANAGGYAALAARSCGMDVRFADVEDRDLLVSRRTLEQALTPRTSMVVVTHLYGKMAPVAAVCDLCRSRGIAVVEDCAQAAGAHAGGRYAGSFGDAAAFSFYPTKNLAAIGDGGAIATSDAQVAARARRLSQYGWGDKYRVREDGGGNWRMDEIQAAVLRVRLPRLDERNRRRRAIARSYARALATTPVGMAQEGGDDYVAHLAVVRTPRREELAEALGVRGIGTAVHYPLPDHRQKIIGAPAARLPVTERACEQVLTLPCFPELEYEETETVCAALEEIALEDVARWL